MTSNIPCCSVSRTIPWASCPSPTRKPSLSDPSGGMDHCIYDMTTVPDPSRADPEVHHYRVNMTDQTISLLIESEVDLMEQDYIVWLSEPSRIASFHPVEGYQKQIFLSHDFFMSYLQNLQNQGYRFQ